MEDNTTLSLQTKPENVCNKKQAIFPIAELISTEVDYLVVLHNIVNGYLREYRNPNSKISPPRNLKNSEGLVFANIDKIFEWHRDYFLKSLVLNQHNLCNLAAVFIENESKFQMYDVYGKGKSMSNFLVNKNIKYFEKVKRKLDLKSDLSQMLISPIRRLAGYNLLLTEIIKHAKKAGIYDDLPSLYEARNMIKSVNESVNNYRILEGIQDITSNYGKLLHHGYLTCDYKFKKQTKCLLYVFVCKKFIIFTHKEDSSNPFDIPSFKVFLAIPMNKIQMCNLSDDSFVIYSNCEPNPEYHVFCSTDNCESHQKWMNALGKQLQLQNNFSEILVNPSDYSETSSINSRPSDASFNINEFK